MARLLEVLGELHHAVAEDAARAVTVSLLDLARAAGWCAGRRRCRRASWRCAPTLGEMLIPLSLTIRMMSRVGVAGVVHPLVGEAAGQRAVADDGHDLVVAALQVARGGHAERRRHRGAGVPGAEVVVRALVALQEAGDAARLAQRREGVVAAGEQLPGVGLVSDVPDDLVGRGIELVQQRDGQLDHAEAGADVAAGDGNALDQAIADLLRQLRELFPGNALEVGGAVDGSRAVT